MLTGADVLIGMAREHVREAVVLAPDVWGRAFTLKEIVRLGEERGGRAPDEPLEQWLARLQRAAGGATCSANPTPTTLPTRSAGPAAATSARPRNSTISPPGWRGCWDRAESVRAVRRRTRRSVRPRLRRLIAPGGSIAPPPAASPSPRRHPPRPGRGPLRSRPRCRRVRPGRAGGRSRRPDRESVRRAGRTMRRHHRAAPAGRSLGGVHPWPRPCARGRRHRPTLRLR